VKKSSEISVMWRTHIQVLVRPLLAIAVLCGSYLILKSWLDVSHNTALRKRNYILSVSSKESLVSQPLLVATQGDAVCLIVSSIRDAELHVHGDEKSVGIGPERVSTLTFVVDHAGSFPIHVHERDGTMLQLAVLEVQPR
jgi:hypothetical protein